MKRGKLRPGALLARLVRVAAIAALLIAGCSVDELLDDDKEENPATGVTCYSSFTSFKRTMKRQGKEPPKGHDWHHIVEQNSVNKKRFPSRLHCTDNLIAIPRKIHGKISGYYSSKPHWTHGRRVRDVISERTWEAQYEYGLQILRRNGIDP